MHAMRSGDFIDLGYRFINLHSAIISKTYITFIVIEDIINMIDILLYIDESYIFILRIHYEISYGIIVH